MPRLAQRIVPWVLFAVVSTGLAQEPLLRNWQAPARFLPPASAVRSAAGEQARRGDGLVAENSGVAPQPLFFVAMAPCRHYMSPGGLPSGTPVTIPLTGAPCNIPASAQAVSANFALYNIAGATGNGVLTTNPTGNAAAIQALINYPMTQGQIDNAAVVTLGTGGAIDVTPNQGGGTANLIIDVNGYYTQGGEPNQAPNTAGDAFHLQAGGASTGSTDLAGGDLVLSAGTGTGLGGGGNTRIQTAGANDLSGTADNLLVDRVIHVGKAKQLTLAAPGFTSLMSIHLVGTHTAGGRIYYSVRATDGGSQIATEEGIIQYAATANSITCTVQTADKLHLGTVNSGCTPGFFNPGSQPGISIFDNVSFSTPASIVVHEVYFTIENESGSTIRLEP